MWAWLRLLTNTLRTMNKKYLYTSQKELRAAFWQFCDECGIDYKGKKSKFNLDLNMMFNDWKDGLQKDGTISEALCFRACLYR